jgi:hypothetical protein
MSGSPTLSGQCLCGAVRFKAAPSKPEMDVCHCGMCRRWSGGVFMAVDCGNSLEIVDGTELAVYRSSDWGERGFCRQCGSSLFWRGVDDGHVAVSIQAFDDPGRFEFVEEIFIDEKPDNYAFVNDTRKKTGAEVFAEFTAKQESADG